MLSRFIHLQKQVRPLFDTKDRIHGWDHALQVVENAQCIFENCSLNINSELLAVSALLHDLHYSVLLKNKIYAYIFESRISSRVARDVLDIYGIEFSQEEKEIIIKAIYNHPHSFPFRRLNKNKDLYSQVLQDADTMELFNPERAPVYLHKKQTKPRSFLKKLITNFNNYFTSHIGLYINLECTKHCSVKKN